eukprot:3805877-Alexandrium_andersonii.AAC.1
MHRCPATARRKCGGTTVPPSLTVPPGAPGAADSSSRRTPQAGSCGARSPASGGRAQWAGAHA